MRSLPGQSLKRLCKLPQLEVLELARTPVGDADVKQLAGMKRLVSLSLYAAPVSDEVVDTLANIKTLKSIDLRDTKISEDGVTRLRKALPNCHILSYFPEKDRPAKRKSKT
jgi:hypothetical protein